jgi:IS30 family transposase
MKRGYVRGRHRKNHIPGRVPIHLRPRVVETRHQGGHWEIDTAVSRQSLAALLVCVERKTRFTKLFKLPRKTARNLSVAVNRSLSHYPPALRRTLTYDNGSENADHLRINRVLGSSSFFCAPYHSWEKGSVENVIGLFRRYYPKKTDLARLSHRQIRFVETALNCRPRKCLKYRTPHELFSPLKKRLRA